MKRIKNIFTSIAIWWNGFRNRKLDCPDCGVHFSTGWGTFWNSSLCADCYINQTKRLLSYDPFSQSVNVNWPAIKDQEEKKVANGGI